MKKMVFTLSLAVSHPHSSAKYYHTGEQGVYEITGYQCLEDIDLTK
ncbi:MAG: hypothetical protein JJE22_07910 [Bacteroidia bacterium]|nr:hypothetical protein [Bacteroidia bacterium]